MDIDIYQQCPCHSEKKIKFCCGKDIVNDLNQILAKNSSGQAKSALDQLDRAIEKTGPKDCLLTIQTHILIANGEIDKAKVANELFLKNNPDHSTGLHHQALINLAEEKIVEAVSSLQDAMDAIVGNEIPISLANAFRMIGLGLLSEGHVVGARAHLQYAQVLKGGGDEELERMIYESFRLPNASMLLKSDFRLPKVEEEFEWAKKYNNVIRAIDRGQFRKGLKFLKKIDKNFPDQIPVLRGIAILSMYLGDLPAISAAYRRLSTHESLPELDAIEAEAIAQLFESDAANKIEIVRVTFEVGEIDGAQEIALSSPRLASVPAVGEDPFEEGPAPRSSFYVLDRDKITSAENAGFDDLPDVSGELLLYGKQTDRSARLEWVSAKGRRFAGDKEQLMTTFADFVQGEPVEAAIAETTELADTLTWNWHLPEDITRPQHSKFVQQKRQQVLTEGWANLKFPVLDNKSPKDVAGDAGYVTRLGALLMHLEQSPDGQFGSDNAIDELRKSLGLKSIAKIDPTENKDQHFTPIQQQYLEYEKLTDEQLMAVQSEAMMIGNMRVLKLAVPEVLNRPELEQVPRDVSLSMMAQLTDDDDEALDYLSKARTEAKRNDRPIGLYLVQEFEFRIARGLTDKLPTLLQTIQMHHLKDPDVEYQLARVLQKYGLLQGDPMQGGSPMGGGAPASAPPPASAAPQDTSSPIWTPDSGPHAGSESAGADDSGEGETSKLWVPD